MTDRYLTLAEIAAAAGITTAAARQLHKRSTANRAKGKPSPGDLPAENIRLGITPGWRTTPIAEWLKQRKSND